jgi:hypothetical protein
LDNRDELYVRGIEFPAEETIDIQRAFCIEMVHTGERVERHTGSTQKICSGHHLIEGRRTSFVNTESVVKFARTVDAQSDQEPVLFKKLRPLLFEQDAVSLKIVFDALSGLGVPLLKCDYSLEEVEAAQRRLSTLPGEDDLRARIAFDVLAYEKLKYLVSHLAGAWPAWQGLFAQIEAVLAVQVAGGAARLRHDVKASWPTGVVARVIFLRHSMLV